MRLSAALATFAVAATTSLAAHASPLIELTGAPSGGGNATARAYGSGAAETYFNPARLIGVPQQLELGILVVADRIGITVDGRSRGDVPDVVGGRAVVDARGQPISNATVPSRWLSRGCPPDECKGGGFAARPRQAAGSSGNTRAYQIIGLVSHLVPDRVVLGLYALVPLGPFTTAQTHYVDEREQFFSNSLHPELYSDRLTATSVAFGGGVRISRTVSAGLSFTLNLRNTAEAGTYVRDPDDYDQILIATKVQVRASVSPHVGVRWTPTDRLDFSATVHSEQRFVVVTDVKALLPTGTESKTTRTSVHDFVPWTFGLGGAYDVWKSDERKIAVVAQTTYALWSGYVDRHGLGPAYYGSEYAWSNTFSPSVGARGVRGPWRSGVDVSFTPTPVPLQTGRSSYVDNDRWTFAANLDRSFRLGPLRLRAGVSGQVHVLVTRSQKKDDRKMVDEVPDDARTQAGAPIPDAAGLQTNSPGWPGFSSRGAIFAGAATLGLEP